MMQGSFFLPGYEQLVPAVKLWPLNHLAGNLSPAVKVIPNQDGKPAFPTPYKITPKLTVTGKTIPLDECAPSFVSGGEVLLHVDVQPVLTVGVTGYEWTVSGAITASSSEATPVMQKLPAAGSVGHIEVVVSLGDATAAYGSLDFTVIDSDVAGRMTKVCHFAHKMEHLMGSPEISPYGPAVDPTPWIAALKATHDYDERALVELASSLRVVFALLQRILTE